MTRAYLVLAVASGGAVGATLRYFIGLLVSLRFGHLAWATMSINLVGCFLMGFLAEWFFRLPIASSEHSFWIQAFLFSGLLGGFTTFSTFALEFQRLYDTAAPIAFLYGVVSVVGGIALAWLGRYLVSI